LRAVPNPTKGQLRIEPELATDEPYLLFDAKGLLVGGGTLHARSMLDISQLSAGVYTIYLTRSGNRLPVIRE
jgi:hypothetical protein